MYSAEIYGRIRRACHVDGMSIREAARHFLWNYPVKVYNFQCPCPNSPTLKRKQLASVRFVICCQIRNRFGDVWMSYGSTFLNLNKPPKNFAFHFRYKNRETDYILCAQALIKVVQSILPTAQPSYANSPMAILFDLFFQLNAYPQRMWQVEVPLTWSEFSNFVALLPDFKTKALPEFKPRVDYYFLHARHEMTDGFKSHSNAYKMMTQGWFAGETGVILQIHTELLNRAHENSKKMTTHYGKKQSLRPTRYRPHPHLSSYILQ